LAVFLPFDAVGLAAGVWPARPAFGRRGWLSFRLDALAQSRHQIRARDNPRDVALHRNRQAGLLFVEHGDDRRLVPVVMLLPIPGGAPAAAKGAAAKKTSASKKAG